MVEKTLYYAHKHKIPHPECAPVDGQIVGPHAAAILAIADDDLGFVAWRQAKKCNLVRSECTAHIEQTLGWSAQKQRSALAGVYSAGICDAMREAIAASIAECNRCEDIIAAGQMAVPVWPVAPDALSYEEAKNA